VSIYSSFSKQRPANDHDVRDISAPVMDGDVRRPVSVPSPWPVAAPDGSALRKSNPANYLFPASIRWFASLPVDTRPVALAAQYARIVNLLALAWINPAACREHFDDLLADRRGGRRGFPADVRRELLRLCAHYFTQYPVGEDRPARTPSRRS
jgi:hypothetical protein